MDSVFAPPTGLTGTDELDIRRLIEVYGHLVDTRHWDELTRVFSDDIVFDLSPLGWGVFDGLESLLEKWRTIEHPLGHHMTNVVLVDGADGGHGVWSKGISVLSDGTVRSNEYIDVVERRPEGWRVTHRTVRRRDAHQ